ncbi:hypothetical protein Tco_1173675 [Tanacetum coccineum]|uniref:Uncharacterized protein n=1 Tax=Tanacetum coccineum TaxID=301880 RepID=A0ABQ5JBX7_9ASTR
MEKLAERAYAIERGLWTTDAVSSQTFMIEEILQWQKYYHKDEDYVGEFIDGDTAGRGCVVERESRESERATTLFDSIISISQVGKL